MNIFRSPPPRRAKRPAPRASSARQPRPRPLAADLLEPARTGALRGGGVPAARDTSPPRGRSSSAQGSTRRARLPTSSSPARRRRRRRCGGASTTARSRSRTSTRCSPACRATCRGATCSCRTATPAPIRPPAAHTDHHGEGLALALRPDDVRQAAQPGRVPEARARVHGHLCAGLPRLAADRQQRARRRSSSSTSPRGSRSSADRPTPARSRRRSFTVLNYLLPLDGALPMHCSANVGADGDVAIFFGLSGQARRRSPPIRPPADGDDEHGWSESGIFNFEDGCYAKVIRLSPQAEPQIHACTRALRHDPRERDDGSADASTRSQRRLGDGEHARRLSAALHRQRAAREMGGTRRTSSSSPATPRA